MFRFTECQEKAADVVIDARRVSDFAVPAEYFGKFSEVIGQNVYRGFWAQALENPSLEPVKGCLKDSPDDERMDLAYEWFGWNAENAIYALADDAYNTTHSQSITVREIPEGASGVGIFQQLYLPLAREKTFDLSFFTRGSEAPIVVEVCLAHRPGLVLGRQTLDVPAPGDWREVSTVLTLDSPDDIVERPTPLWFRIGLAKPGSVQIDQITLWPRKHIEGFDPKVIALLRDYGVTVLRFPGGNYVSGYHWKDDLGPMDQRPTKPNPAWNSCDPHHVGTDEHIRLCRLLGAEPLICVNAGDGTPREAADWVEYCNGATDTKWGAVRTERGYPEPFNVRTWELGNELWGSWQIGHCTAEEYVERYKAFSKAMLAADPTIRLIACGHKDDFAPGWTDTLLEGCGDAIEAYSVHFLFTNSPDASPVSTHLSHMGYSHAFETIFRRIDAKARARGIGLKIAITELMEMGMGKAYQVAPRTQSEALYFAGTFHSAIRTEGMVDLITYSALINHGAGIRNHAWFVFPTPSFFARRQLRETIGSHPLAFQARTPFERVPEWQAAWSEEEHERFPLIDIMPLLGEDALRIVVLNRDPHETIPVRIRIENFRVGETMNIFELAGETFMSGNDALHPDRVTPTQTQRPAPEPREPILLDTPPASFTVVTLRKGK